MRTIDALKKLHRETKAEVYFVGGFVRDGLLGIDNKDLDIVVRKLSESGVKKFLRQYGKIKKVKLSQTNERFQVNIILFRAYGDDIEAQITTPRKGKKQKTNPEFTLKSDSRYRDFTINCLYMPVDATSKGDVIDYSGGINSLKRRIVEANGNPNERIKESPVRIMRAFSLAARLNFDISIKVLLAVAENIDLLRKVPAEGIRTEFEKVIMSDNPSRYLKLMQRFGVIKIIAPELENCVGVTQEKKYHKYDVFSHLVYTVDHAPKNHVIRLAGLLHDTGKAVTRKVIKRRITFHKHEVESVHLARKFLDRFKYDTITKRKVLALVRLHMYHYTREWTDSAIRRFVKSSGISADYIGRMEEFPLFQLRAAERLGSGFKKEAITERQRDFEKRLEEVMRETSALEIKDLAINGDDIKEAFKIPEGKKVGDTLKYLLKNVLENQTLNNKNDLLKLATEFLHCK